MTFKFGRRSTECIESCDEKLQIIAKRSIAVSPYDFAITHGHRPVEEQYKLYQEGRTQIDGKKRKSNHNFLPSRAYDFVPWPVDLDGENAWHCHERFYVIAGVMFSVAKSEGIKIRWGGDWDGDGMFRDTTLLDLPHIELIS